MDRRTFLGGLAAAVAAPFVAKFLPEQDVPVDDLEFASPGGNGLFEQWKLAAWDDVAQPDQVHHYVVQFRSFPDRQVTRTWAVVPGEALVVPAMTGPTFEARVRAVDWTGRKHDWHAAASGPITPSGSDVYMRMPGSR